MLKSVIILGMFAIIGYALAKGNTVDAGQTKIISSLIVYFFLPCKLFLAFSRQMKVETFSKNMKFLLLSVAVFAANAVAAYVVSRASEKEKYIRNVYLYSLITTNYGAFGYYLVENAFGKEALFYLMLFTIPYSIFTNTVGFCMLTKREVSLKKLANPIMCSMLAGTVFGLFDIPIPAFIVQFLEESQVCIGPLSMLVLGFAISQFRLVSVFANYKSYIITAVRLIALPLLFLPFKALVPKDFFGVVFIYLMLPCGLNTVIFPKLAGEDVKTGASLAAVSSVCACVTIPLLSKLL